MKKSTVLSLLLIIATLLVNQQANAQNQNYAIFWGDDEIGAMSVSRVQKGARVDFSFLAEVEFRVIVKYKRTTQFKASFIDDTLQSCSSKSIMNEKLKQHQTTKRDKGFYRIFRHPSEKSILRKIITHSVAMLYYKEPPSGLDSIYAEGHSKFCKLEKMQAGKYKLYLDDNKENIYTYSQGKLKEVEVNRSWFDLVFKRIH